MNLLHFIEEFPTEQSCREHFRFQREDEGVVCKNCGGMHQYWLKAKEQWQCATCGFRSTQDVLRKSCVGGGLEAFFQWS